ncbi:hypothetical protein HDV00_001330 [Rhizophlyctis rosea]|nr:hypothetical protein HDV00_001330 [Rhizophlyctis rosea]
MIKELDIGAAAADNLYMGDLDATLAICTGLEVFRLENCFHISGILVRSLGMHCGMLKQVDLPGCPISDSFVPHLTKNCPNLERLDLSFTNLTIASLHAIITHCPALLQLDLSECREIESDVTLDYTIKESYNRPLQWLNLRNAPVGDDLLRFTAVHCPNIQDLILESCTLITDDSLVKLASSLTQLRRLDISFLDNITDLSLNAFTLRAQQSYPNYTLEELYLSACDMVTPQAVHALVQKATKLECLVLDGCEKILGSFVGRFAIKGEGEDELECLVEGEGLRKLAAYVPTGSELGSQGGVATLTPPMSPDRNGLMAPQADGRPTTPTPFKVEVSYATYGGEDEEDPAGKWKSPLKPRSLDSAALAAAALAAAKQQGYGTPEPSPSRGASPSLSRRTSRTMLRPRRSSMNLNLADAVAEAEAMKQERAEKIREKRRSRTISLDAAGAAQLAAALASNTPPAGGAVGNLLGSEKRSEEGSRRGSPPIMEEPESYATVPIASGRRPSPAPAVSAPQPQRGWSANVGGGAQSWGAPPPVTAVSQQGQGQASGWGTNASDPWNQSQQSQPQQQPQIVAAGPGPFAGSQWAGPTPPTSPGYQPALKDAARRRSIPVPAGPPPGAAQSGWSTPAGLQPPSGPVSTPGSKPIPSPIATSKEGMLLAAGRSSAMNKSPSPNPTSPAPTTPTGDGILLASGRAARAAAQAAAAAAAAAQVQGTPEATEGAPQDGNSILIASGRRRSRTMSQSGPPAGVTSPTSNNGPTSNLPPPPANPQPWGANPQVWTNPAQLTSASSTWSTQNNSGPAQNTFVDPWAKPPNQTFAPPSNDPWAAPPSSQNQAPTQSYSQPAMNSGYGQNQNQTYGQSNGYSSAPSNHQNSYFPPPPQQQPHQQQYQQPQPPQQQQQPHPYAPPQQQNSWGTPPSHTPVTSSYNQPPPPQNPPATLRMVAAAGWGPAPSQWTTPSSPATPYPPSPSQGGFPPAPPSVTQQGQGGVYFERSKRMSMNGAPAGFNANNMGGNGSAPRPQQQQQQQRWSSGPNGGFDGGARQQGHQRYPSGGGIPPPPPTANQGYQQQGQQQGGDEAGETGGFVFSNPRRGKMLLKLKIETKTGGHQTLAVHEFDDPHQLATEFCQYWDMAAFREPLVRLVSVRKTNAIRQQTGHRGHGIGFPPAHGHQQQPPQQAQVPGQ